jgi:hypothetical protein
MTSLSLNGSLRTCKVDQGWANRIQSDRFENPELMVCPVWSGFDLTNRPVCIDSFYTKSEGCNSALDRVSVENFLRPQYMEYINLDAEGFRQGTYDIEQSKSQEGFETCRNPNTNMDCYNAGVRTIGLNQLPRITGNFGTVPSGADVYPRCGSYPYNRAERQEAAVAAEANRQVQAVQHSTIAQVRRQQSGMR